MAIYIYLEADDRASWVKLGADGQQLSHGHGQLNEIDTAGTRVTVFVPGEDVLLCHAQVPGSKRRLLAQAVPYALEDQLIDDVEEQHFSFGAIKGDEVDVAVVGHAQMETWLTRLREAGIEANALIADVQAVPLVGEEQSWSLYQFNNRCLLRQAPQSAVVQDADNAGFMLQAALAECGDIKPEQVHFRYAAETPLELPELDVAVDAEPLNQAAVVVLAQAYAQSGKAINLLQGPYSKREQISKYWRPWRAAAALLVGVVVLQMGLSVADQQRLSAEKQQLAADIKQIYRDTFPEARKVVNAKVQMERALKSLQGGGGGMDGFSLILAKAGQEFQATRKMSLERVSYKNGLLDVSLFVADLQQLDQLKQRLSDNAKLSVDIHSATAKDNRVEARLRIKEAS